MMSSQAERIRAFKHAQHARLQKQEDEEWISSEELCTEGSSDEETNTNTKRKPKRTLPGEKRGISPLAQPPKTFETESTSTYPRDSKYLLPGSYSSEYESETADIDFKVQQLNINVPSSGSSKANKPDLSKSQDSTQSTTSSNSSIDDINDEILWRPKRGSIKLPELPEGKQCTVEHDNFNESILFGELAANLNHLKQACARKRILPPTEVGLRRTSDNVGPREKEIFNLWQSVANLDCEISSRIALFEDQKNQRKSVQEEVCKILNTSEVSRSHTKTSEVFLQLCNFENEDQNIVTEEDTINLKNNKISSDLAPKRIKTSNVTKKDYVTRNIQLATQSTMSSPLTDEEKVKLDNLLSDIDLEKYSSDGGNKSTKDNIALIEEPSTDKEGLRNYFKIDGDEMAYIKELDEKLNEIIQSYHDRGERIRDAFEETKEIDDFLQTTDNSGKLWKHFNLQQRLERIEKELAAIASEDAIQNKASTEKLAEDADI